MNPRDFCIYRRQGVTLYQLPPNCALPALPCEPPLSHSELHSVIFTPEETSIISTLDLASVPQFSALIQKKEDGWALLKLRGPFDFTLFGILAQFTGVLKDAKVSAMALASWNTDYIAIRSDHVDIAMSALIGAGWNCYSAD